jgi:hypothetical protein
VRIVSLGVPNDADSAAPITTRIVTAVKTCTNHYQSSKKAPTCSTRGARCGPRLPLVGCGVCSRALRARSHGPRELRSLATCVARHRRTGRPFQSRPIQLFRPGGTERGDWLREPRRRKHATTGSARSEARESRERPAGANETSADEQRESAGGGASRGFLAGLNRDSGELPRPTALGPARPSLVEVGASCFCVGACIRRGHSGSRLRRRLPFTGGLECPTPTGWTLDHNRRCTLLVAFEQRRRRGEHRTFRFDHRGRKGADSHENKR